MGGMEINDLLIYGGAAVGGLVVLLVVLKSLGGKKKKGHKDLEKTQHERLDEYPNAPPVTGGKRLVLDGLDVRLRLVVFAPVGTEKRPIDPDDAPELFDDLIRGLGSFIKSDKPRVRVWPPQLSTAGWPPTFFRLVESPDVEHRKSNWIRVAGTIKIAGNPHLLGLALYAEEASKVGTVILEPPEWARRFQIEKM